MFSFRLRRHIQYLPLLALGAGGLMLVPGGEDAGLDAATIVETLPARPSYLAGPPIAAEPGNAASSTAEIRTVEVDPKATIPPPIVTASLSVPPVAEVGVTDAPGFFTRAALTSGATADSADVESTTARLAHATTAVNVRAGPSSSTARLFVLQSGESVRALSDNGGWVEVETASGDTGWVYSRYLEVGSGTAAIASAQKEVEEEPGRPVEVASAEPDEPRRVDGRTARAGSDMTLHAGPSGGSPQLFVLERGERVTIAETRGSWARVILRSGASGWVRLR